MRDGKRKDEAAIAWYRSLLDACEPANGAALTRPAVPAGDAHCPRLVEQIVVDAAGKDDDAGEVLRERIVALERCGCPLCFLKSGGDGICGTLRIPAQLRTGLLALEPALGLLVGIELATDTFGGGRGLVSSSKGLWHNSASSASQAVANVARSTSPQMRPEHMVERHGGELEEQFATNAAFRLNWIVIAFERGDAIRRTIAFSTSGQRLTCQCSELGFTRVASSSETPIHCSQSGHRATCGV